MCDSAGDDLEPGLAGVGHKEPRADNQLPHGRRPLHGFQHGRKPPRHNLQGQEDQAHGATLRKPAAGIVCVCGVFVCIRIQTNTQIVYMYL